MSEEKSRGEKYNEGYKDAKDECDEKMNKKECVDLFIDGYKKGFQDGYKAAAEEIKEMKMMIIQMPPETRQKMMEEGAQGGWPIWW